MTIVSVHQPNYLPWTKLLDKILASDIYVAYDTAQFTKSEFHSRQLIKRQNGPGFLTVPLIHPGHQPISTVRIDNRTDHRLDFRRKHLDILAQDYRRAHYFDEVYAMVEDVYSRNQELLVDLNLDLIRAFLSYLDSPTTVVRASSLPHEGDNTQRLIQLIHYAGGNAHLTSTYGSKREYIEWDRVQGAGITLLSQDFTHPVYGQVWGEFAPNISAVDMLFHCGPDTASILAEQRHTTPVPVLVEQK